MDRHLRHGAGPTPDAGGRSGRRAHRVVVRRDPRPRRGPAVRPTAAIDSSLSDDDIADAVYAAKLISYTQGFMVLADASATNDWDLDLASIARMWRGGCIIRAAFLDDIARAFEADPDLENLLFDPFFTEAITAASVGLRRTVVAAAAAGVAVPALASALTFYDGIRTRAWPGQPHPGAA